MKKAKKYVTEWLELRVAEGCSAWTINLEAAALNKFYEIAPDDPKRFQCPRRNRVDIKRSRGQKERDKHFARPADFDVTYLNGCTEMICMTAREWSSV